MPTLKFIINIILSISSGLGFIFIFSPFFLYWWIHGDYSRYLWIISGPYPFSHLGSGPFQLAFYVLLLLSGVLSIALTLILKKFCKNI